jgi:GTPase SAR1 family protein
MEKVMSALEELEKINSAYGISNDGIERLRGEINSAKVCIPVIGKFSSGKSSMINALLGYSRDILKTAITPKTAIPTEILYTSGNDEISVEKIDGAYKIMTVEEFISYEPDASTDKRATLKLNNRALSQNPDVMLVDMPGFESGYEVHNRAIDDYLPRSMAYIITVPADDLIIRSSVGNILKELCLHDMPLCLVVAKYDKRTPEFEDLFEKLKTSLKRFVGDREITYCLTASHDGDIEQLADFLADIQEKSQEIMADKYRKIVLPLIENTEQYLVTTLNGSRLSESDLAEKEDELKNKLSKLETSFHKESEDFDVEVAQCIEGIKSDVQSALNSEESSLVTMALNNQDIKERINCVVRKAVTESVQKRLIPLVEKYLKKVQKTLNADSIGDVNVQFYFDTNGLNKNITGSIVAVVAGILLSLPIAGLIVGLIMKLANDKKREEAKENIRAKLRGEVYPQILREVGINLEKEVNKQVGLINTSIENELKNQKDILNKAMEDVRGQMDNEKAQKENLAIDINNDLERIKEVKDGLRG